MGRTCAVHMLTAKILWGHTVAFVKKGTLGMDLRAQVSFFVKGYMYLWCIAHAFACMQGCHWAASYLQNLTIRVCPETPALLAISLFLHSGPAQTMQHPVVCWIMKVSLGSSMSMHSLHFLLTLECLAVRKAVRGREACLFLQLHCHSNPFPRCSPSTGGTSSAAIPPSLFFVK